MTLFRDSWVGAFLNYEIKTNEGVVQFVSKKDDTWMNNRFTLYIQLPGMMRHYFLPQSDWERVPGYTQSRFIQSSVLSFVTNGFQTKSFPYSKSALYTTPFFLSFNSMSHDPNYLKFESFLKPNTNECILAMLVFNDDTDKFESIFSPLISLSSLKSLVLSNRLEFILTDANKNIVNLANHSQLFVSITVDPI